MCIICLEFNKRRDLGDAATMVEAARRESAFISEEHLKQIEAELQKMKEAGTTEALALPTSPKSP